MTAVGPPRVRPDVRWWLDRGRVQGFIQGVFEGGGAKGVLYAGALEGVLRRKLWFSAVAGSSAGAITAAMIAAGMEPSELRVESDRGRDVLALPTALNGLRRVRWGTGFLDHEGVSAWVREVLCKQCRAAGVSVDDRGPTFEDLYRRVSGIELFVAAVDLRARHLAVFHHALTPNARVADAVMASASIPVAFEPLVFQSSFKGSLRWRLFVDGGVASNFPAFVFQDEGFRAYAGLGQRSAHTPVVGFLLDEEAENAEESGNAESPLDVPERREETRDVYRSGDFVGPYFDGVDVLREFVREPMSSGRPRFRARTDNPPRWRRPFRAVRRALASVLGIVEIVVLTPITWLARAVEPERQRQAFTWRWRNPNNRHARLWIPSLRGWLSTSTLPLFVGIVLYTSLFWLGFVAAARYLVPDLASIGGIVSFLFLLAGLVVATWVWLLGLATFLSLRVAYRTLGILGADIFQTYLNTSAPPWAGRGPNEYLVRLKAKGVTTLRVEEGVDVVTVLEQAEEAAFVGLEGVRGGPPPTGSSR